MLTIHSTDALSALVEMPDGVAQTCVTSPPYWGLRDYGLPPLVWDETVECEHEWIMTRQYKDSPTRTGAEGVGFDDATTTKAQRWREQNTCHCGAWKGCLGLEPTPELYVQHIVQIFREVRRVLRDDGTLWINLGDSYNSQPGQRKQGVERNDVAGWKQATNTGCLTIGSRSVPNLKPKDLVGIPWMVAFALRSDGWYLRSDIIWAKPNPMPESVTDRPTKSHEYLFLLSKSQKYFYDADAIKEPMSLGTEARRDRDDLRQKSGWDDAYMGNPPRGLAGNGNGGRKSDKQRGHSRRHAGFNDRWDAMGRQEQCSGMRNKRSVWTIATIPFADAHFATFPRSLVTPCILAGSRVGDVVVDSCGGSGTVGKVAIETGRRAILIEPNLEYVKMIKRRCETTIGLPLESPTQETVG